ncbi:integrin alpha-6-like [Cololabis saira]|uniref:integrin alpha-6-like n=1 Tax=Cololabis saira TaxID=129043 RepID=UPI002AD2536B|nr:integrin alpha-6-like [Cololabis saira]
MSKYWPVVCLWIIWHRQILNVAAFNLDTENVAERKGDAGTLFGFSVAFHKQLSPSAKSLLLVGAPRAKHQNEVNVTGVVYGCDLTTTSERCQPIEFEHEEFLDSKGVNNQWMGVKVASQGPGKNVMTCAHRYQQWSPSPGLYTPQLFTGQCYILGDDLQVGTEERRWRRVVCDNEHLTRRQKDHEWFAYCQQGHGAAFAKDNKSVLFGAPGAYQWKGTVRMEVLDDLMWSSDDPREAGDIEQFNQELIPLLRNSYLGFSVDSGMALTRKGQLTIVSGAPRGGYSGQVAFLKKDPAAKRSLSVELVLSEPGLPLSEPGLALSEPGLALSEPGLALSEPGLASSFGYDVTVVDLNADGWEDLVVGAPQFIEKDKDIGGAVFIYINTKGKHWETIVPIRLDGHKDSMFGLAVENIGDINQDGYGDFAVGAPYEGSGRVYVYCGSSGGINRKAAQVLSPGSNSVKMFGYSLAGNLDVDDNQYPDLAVGSLSDSVFIFRTRSVVSVSTSFSITPNHINIIKKRCNERTCYFAGQACFTYTAHPSSFNPKLMLNYTFEADFKRRESKPRVDFLGSYRGTLELPGQGRKTCADMKLQLLRDISDKLRSIPTSVTVSLWTNRTGADTTNIPPVLDIYQQKTTVSEIILINEACGHDGTCQSNLQLQYKFCSKKTQNGEAVFKSLVREDGVAVITPSDEDVALEITVTNRNGDDAHQSHLVVTLPDALRYSSIVHSGSAETDLSCAANDNGTLIDCELGNPLQRDAEITFYVLLTTSGISLSTEVVNVTLQLETTSLQTIQPVEVLAKVMFELQLQVHGQVRPSQVSLGDISKGAIKSLDEIGTSVRYNFRITNLGKPLRSFANASLIVRWPKENSAGKWLLYLTHVSTEGVQPVPCSPAHEIHPLKDIKGWDAPPRNRREAEFEALSTEEFPFLPTKRKYKTLTCSDGLKCVEMHCPLLGLDSTALVLLHSRLWNSTLVEDYSSLNYLDIVVDATLSLTNSPGNIRFKSDQLGTQVKLTVFLERKPELLIKVAWWIIFLTVIALLLLLAVFVFFLWKRGCIHSIDRCKKSSEDGEKKALASLKG